MFRASLTAIATASLLSLTSFLAAPSQAAGITDFDGFYEANNNLLVTTCTSADTSVSNDAYLPVWYFTVEKGVIKIEDWLLGQITGNSGTATMTISSSQIAGIEGINLTGPVNFSIQTDGSVAVSGTLTSRYNEVCTQTLQLSASTQDSFRFTVDAVYPVKRGKAVKGISLCQPPQTGKCGWPKKPDNPSSSNRKASFSFSVAHFSFSSQECEPFGTTCGFLPRGLKLNLFTGKITGAPAASLKKGDYPVRLCATEFSSSKRVCRSTIFRVT